MKRGFPLPAKPPSNRHLHLDRLVRRVSLELEVLVHERIDAFLFGSDGESGERTGVAAQLLSQRFYMVEVHVCISDGVDELASLEVTHLW